jgi:hypothetical protein
MVALLLVGACGTKAAALGVRPVPANLIPSKLDQYAFKYEPAPSKQYKKAGPDALVSDGKVYSISAQGATEGAIELTVYKPDVDISDIDDESMTEQCANSPEDCPGHEIFMGIQSQLGTGRFQRIYYRGYERSYKMALPDQTIYLWFPPRTESMVMLILVGSMGQPASDDLFRAVLDFQHHRAVGSIAAPAPVTPKSTGAALPAFGPSAAPTPTPTPTPKSGGNP